jgi:hypothetical protein
LPLKPPLINNFNVIFFKTDVKKFSLVFLPGALIT